MLKIQLTFCILLMLFTSNIRAQQNYSGDSVFNCDHKSDAAPSPSYLYTCNGRRRTCQTFLIFISQPNYNSVTTISQLLSSNPSELARINNVSDSYIFPSNKEVIIPVNCSCSGQYYQANTSYVIGDDDTYYILATATYQGLSSCSALIGENAYDAENLYGGLNLLIPLRCACPTRNQTASGTKYLLTYSLNEDDNFPDLSTRFNVSNQETLSANGISEQDPVTSTSTTILIPLPREPLSSQTIIHHQITPQPPPPPPSAHPNSKSSNKGLYVGIGVGVFCVLVVCLVFIALWHHRKRVKANKGRKEKCMIPKDVLSAGVDDVLKVFEFEELKEATKDFSSERRIEGSVYRGVVRGTVVAIKKMSRDVTKEVNILHKLNHFNLISLCGIGTGEEHCYLVYEYMENGSLKDWLHDTDRSTRWSWTQRVRIALDVACGLDYIHNFTEPPYVHKDIKSSNVLLNGRLRAKITNFSLARSSHRKNDGSALTKNIEGTFGYMAPEYLQSGLVTPKLDVYAFGVVMLELITGRDVVIKDEGSNQLLSAAVISILGERNAEVEFSSFMDSTLRDSSPIALVMEVAKLSVSCLKQDPERRPSMHEVVTTLSRIQADSERWQSTYKTALHETSVLGR